MRLDSHLKYSKEQIIFHMPHCSTHIPDYSAYKVSKDIILSELSRVTDWGVDDIFDIPEIAKIRFDYSRLYCDVERFYDEGESLAPKGFGIIYTSLENGGLLREISKEEKAQIISNYYESHHQKFTEIVQKKLDEHGEVLIIDCHSYPNKPLMWEEHQSLSRPDICIGTDAFHTPAKLTEYFITFFNNEGYKVAENQPFIGTIVPTKFYKKDKRVKSLMIEVNRKVFMNENTLEIDKEHTLKLRERIEKELKHD